MSHAGLFGTRFSAGLTRSIPRVTSLCLRPHATRVGSQRPQSSCYMSVSQLLMSCESHSADLADGRPGMVPFLGPFSPVPRGYEAPCLGLGCQLLLEASWWPQLSCNCLPELTQLRRYALAAALHGKTGQIHIKLFYTTPAGTIVFRFFLLFSMCQQSMVRLQALS